MFTKRLVMECDWCGEYNFGTCIRDFSKSFPVYKFKPSNPIADELWLKNRSKYFLLLPCYTMSVKYILPYLKKMEIGTHLIMPQREAELPAN